tara:strand:+ start:171 stop:890 length:720 start_codon:yes stop_codon:yes gene_type:complete
MKLIKNINYERIRPLVNLKKISLIILSVLILSISSSGAATKDKKKKDCLYCEKYEKMSDWPESERPKEFIYEEVEYPNEMFGKYDKINSKNRKAAAGKKVYKTFVKQKGSLNKKQHEMVQNMAYFEALYNETLNDPKATVESVEGLKKGREAMRMSLKISPKASTSEAVLKFWATGKMLTKAYKLNKKKKKKVQKQVVDPDIAERAAVLASLKKQIATAKVNAQRAATIEAQKKIGEAE